MSRATRVPCFSLALSTFDLQPTTYRGPDEALTMTVDDVVRTNGNPLSYAAVDLSLTSLFIKLLQDFSYYLPNAL